MFSGDILRSLRSDRVLYDVTTAGSGSFLDVLDFVSAGVFRGSKRRSGGRGGYERSSKYYQQINRITRGANEETLENLLVISLKVFLFFIKCLLRFHSLN